VSRPAVAPSLVAPLLLAAAALLAHPSVSVVMDRRGNVYYSDLEQVWKVAPDGRKTVAVPRVHTHELWLDAGDNLYGEHLWYEGEATNRWGFRVWRRTPEGAVAEVVPARHGFRTDYSFVRDAAGNMYSVDRDASPVAFRRRAPDGSVSTIARCRDCRDVRWMTAEPDGVLWFIDDLDLREVSSTGAIRTVAKGVGRRTITQPQVGRHVVMGLWTDPARNVYAAVYGSREVVRVSPEGRATVVARSSLPWSPTGGLVAPDGELWLLEWSYTNAARVRRFEGFAAARCLEVLDGATAGVEAAVAAFESRDTAAERPVDAARTALALARRARAALEDARVPPVCAAPRSEELVYLNHLVPGFEGWLAAASRVPPADYEITSILRRARAHRERGRARLRLEERGGMRRETGFSGQEYFRAEGGSRHD
jgi:hypothetical protein